MAKKEQTIWQIHHIKIVVASPLFVIIEKRNCLNTAFEGFYGGQVGKLVKTLATRR